MPGIPITGKPNSSLKIRAPVKLPSPPITTKPSMPALFTFSYALARPSFVLKSLDLADFKIVPPLLIMPFTLRASMTLKSPSINPSYPRLTPTHSIL